MLAGIPSRCATGVIRENQESCKTRGRRAASGLHAPGAGLDGINRNEHTSPAETQVAAQFPPKLALCIRVLDPWQMVPN